jgi:hypothetical protein
MNEGRAVLEDEVLGYIGNLVAVGPVYGFGWSAAQPKSFQMRIVEFCRDASSTLRGGIGQVESAGRAFDGRWVVFSARHVGQWGFDNNLGHFNICLFDERPANAVEMAAGVSSFVTAGRAALTCGSGIIGKS